MHIAIVENEPEYSDQLRALCSRYGESRGVSLNVDIFPDARSFLSGFSDGHYSLIFIDIYMEGMSGVELGREIRQRDARALLTFCTTSTDFMPEAFSLHAFEYVTKPFSPERIFQVLEDAQRVAAPASRYIRITSGRQSVSVFLNDIVSAITSGHYIHIGLRDGSVLKSRLTMPEFLALTENDSRFITVNKGIILNADHVALVEEDCCVMDDGNTFPIRMRDRRQIQQRLQDHIFKQIRNSQHHTPQ